MLGLRRGPWLLLMGVALPACAGGGEGPVSTSAFNPAPSGSDGGTASSTGGTDPDGNGMTSLPSSGDVTGDPPPDNSCCEVSPTPGCGNEATEMCVCTVQPSCCQSVWSQQCVDIAIAPCADPACVEPGSTGEPGDSSSGDPPPMVSCDALAMQEGWMYWRCQDGDLQCNGMGTPTTDCDYCCGYCNDAGDVSCGDLATSNGWAPGTALCEWNGNGACGGSGTPTCDCNFCCQA